MKFFGVCPVFRVANLGDALNFYRDVLGFEVRFEWPDYVGVALGEANVHLSLALSGKPEAGSAVYIFCDEIDGYFGTIRARGAVPEREPSDQPYGMRDFSIVDPFGNRLTFGRGLGNEQAAEQ